MAKAQRGGRALKILGFSLLGLLVVGGIIVGILFATGVIKTGGGGGGGGGGALIPSVPGTPASMVPHATTCMPPIVTNVTYDESSQQIKVQFSPPFSEGCIQQYGNSVAYRVQFYGVSGNPIGGENASTKQIPAGTSMIPIYAPRFDPGGPPHIQTLSGTVQVGYGLDAHNIANDLLSPVYKFSYTVHH
jgi:hypothetical protein